MSRSRHAKTVWVMCKTAPKIRADWFKKPGIVRFLKNGTCVRPFSCIINANPLTERASIRAVSILLVQRDEGLSRLGDNFEGTFLLVFKSPSSGHNPDVSLVHAGTRGMEGFPPSNFLIRVLSLFGGPLTPLGLDIVAAVRI